MTIEGENIRETKGEEKERERKRETNTTFPPGLFTKQPMQVFVQTYNGNVRIEFPSKPLPWSFVRTSVRTR